MSKETARIITFCAAMGAAGAFIGSYLSGNTNGILFWGITLMLMFMR